MYSSNNDVKSNVDIDKNNTQTQQANTSPPTPPIPSNVCTHYCFFLLSLYNHRGQCVLHNNLFRIYSLITFVFLFSVLNHRLHHVQYYL